MSLISCQKDDSVTEELETPVVVGGEEPEEPVAKDYMLPEIDLSHWKVTLPVGSPSEVEPPEILEYATNERLKAFMYNDSSDGSLVFYTYPESSTANSSYSRTELREQIEPGSNDVNWTFEEGGRMRGTLAVPEISRDSEGDFHRVIIMQIHGRLTNAQRDQIGEDDNNAPPILKIYWYDGKVRVKTKILKDLNASEEEILHTSAWGDDEGFNFSERVDSDPFTLEIIASEGKMEIILNDDEKVIYESIHMGKWNVFENYFKAGNYLVTTDENAFSKVKFYELEVTH
ncbi:polysaccharide lyase family 7 protein [Christiangramia marina]|uniref:polysaccharide lyase family 7 protein n=1 Tax=Christiangramia marina TaxID=409436 RepID=UPI003AA9DA60